MSNLKNLNGVHVVTTSSERKAFLKFPYQHYKGDECFVPPLLIDQKKLINTQKNPFYQHADIELFLAERNGKTIGRIAAIDNQAYNEYHNTKTGFFGFFECVNDKEVASLLFRVAKDWLRNRDLNSVIGPANPGMMDVVGTLIDGFDRLPVLLYPYNHSYYDSLIKSCGFEKEVDMYNYWVKDTGVDLERLNRGKKIIEKRYPSFRLRTVNMKEIEKEGERIRQIFNKSWADNWGFVPITKPEFKHLIKDLKLIVDPNFIYLVEVDGNTVGFSIALPDWNRALRYLKNGRLLPTGIFKLLYHKYKIDRLRTALMGVLPEYRNAGFDAMMHRETTVKCLESDRLEGSEIGWILETNTPMIRVAEKVNGVRKQTYRMYRAAL